LDEVWPKSSGKFGSEFEPVIILRIQCSSKGPVGQKKKTSVDSLNIMICLGDGILSGLLLLYYPIFHVY